MYMYILNVTTGMQVTSANHLFLLHYELHAEVKPVHWPSVGMLSVENVLICNTTKQKCFKLENVFGWHFDWNIISTLTLSQKEFKKE